MTDEQSTKITLDPRATQVNLDQSVSAAPTGAAERQRLPGSQPQATFSLVVISAGVSDPSSTRMLADRAAQKTIDRIRAGGGAVTLELIELAPLAVAIAQASVAGFSSDELRRQVEKLAAADAVIAATPIYTAGVSGLFKSFLDVLDTDLLLSKPVLLAATAGSSRHALVVDDQMRALFAYMRALTAPTSLFAAPEDWGSPELGKRIDRAATELAALTQSRIGEQIAEQAWDGYQHQFAGNATRAQQREADVDFDSPLMRLATGGSA
jgi:FMN reductase